MGEPNSRLRAARERLPSVHVPGECLSRRELAEAVNAWLYTHTGRVHELDAHYIAKLERGVVRWPSTPYRSALRHVLRTTRDEALGFRPPRRTIASMSTPEDQCTIAGSQQEWLRVRQAPGVVSASISSHTPLSGSTWSEAVAPKGQPVPERDNAIFIAAGPAFFATMQTPLISGRDFDERDHGSPNVAIVNQTFAARYFHGSNI